MFDLEEHRMLTEAQARYWEDEARQRGKRGQLLELLLDGAWYPNHECADITLCFHSVIYALRREGWLIESRHKHGGTWEYRVVGKTEPPPATQRMNSAQRRIAHAYEDAIGDHLGDDALKKVLARIPEWMRLTTTINPEIVAKARESG